MHRRYEALKYKNNRMPGMLDPAEAEILVGELQRMFDHIFKEDVVSAADSNSLRISALAGAASGGVTKPD